MPGMDDEPVDIKDVRLIRETAKAYLIEVEQVEVWIPKSQVEDFDQEEGWLVIPRWLAIEKGLIDG